MRVEKIENPAVCIISIQRINGGWGMEIDAKVLNNLVLI